MNHKSDVDNDLQKAIDDITKTTADDPIFGDPVAAPMPVDAGPIDDIPDPIAAAPEAPAMPEAFEEEVVAESSFPNEPVTPFLQNSHLDIAQIKEAAFRDLIPILGTLDLTASQRFEICKKVIDEYHDKTVIEPAYQAASEIGDDHERAEALLYIVNSIEKF